ncbi:hypothetical protein Tco_1362808 [Tanacetum coccineum]
MIAVNSQRDSVSPPPLALKPKKGKSQTATSTLPKLQGPEVSGALSKKCKKPMSKKPPTETKVTPPKPTEGSEQSHSVSSGTVPGPQYLERNIQLASTGLPSTLDEGTRKSKPLPEGTAKTTPHPEGSLGDKDSGGNIPPADIEPIHTPVADPSGTGAKYQVDETQSTRLRYRSLTKNEGTTSSDVEPDTEPLHLQTFADIQAYLLSEDELEKESDDEEQSHVQESTSDSSSPDLKRFDNIFPLTERKLIKYLRKVSRVLFSRITEKQWEHHEEAAVFYANLKASIDQYYDENIAYRDQTDKLMEASMSSIDRSNTTINDLYKGLYVLSLVKGYDFFALLSTVKDLQAHALKQEEASTSWTKYSTNMAWNLGSRMTAIKISQTALKSEVSSLRQDTLKIKSMMAEIYQAFKGQPFSAPLGSVTPTLALTHILANVEGENATNTATEEPPYHTEGETGDTTMAIPLS